MKHLAVSASNRSAIYAAAECESSELIRSHALISGDERLASPRFSLLAKSLQGGIAGVFQIYEVTNDPFWSWLLAQPIPAE